MQYVQAHERIKAARQQRKLSQKQMAELLEISQPGYQQLESGKYPDMKISTLVKLCEILKVSADWVLGLRPTAEPPYSLRCSPAPDTSVPGDGSVTK